jgi:hypothetical protein
VAIAERSSWGCYFRTHDFEEHANAPTVVQMHETTKGFRECSLSGRSRDRHQGERPHLGREDRGWVRETGVEQLIYAAFMLLVLLTLFASSREHALELPLFCITVLWALAYLIADMTSALTLSF